MNIFRRERKNSKAFVNKNHPSLTEGLSFHDMYNEYPHPAFHLDTNGALLAFNPALTNFLGYSDKDLSRHFHTSFIEENKHKRDRFFNETIHGSVSLFQDAVRLVQGASFEVEVTYIPVVRNDEVEGVYGTIKNSAKDRHSENELFKVKKHIEVTQSLARVGSWDYDIKTEEVYWSNQLYELLGVKNKEISPSVKQIIHFIHPEDREKYRKTIQKAIDKVQGFKLEYKFLIDGSVIFVQEEAVVIRDIEQRPYRIIGTIQDITVQKRNYLELADRENMLQHIYNNLEAGIWTVSLEKNGFTFFSPWLEKFTGYKATYFDSLDTWVSIIHPDDRKEFLKETEVLYSGKPFYQEYRIIRNDGNVVWTKAQAIPDFDTEGNLSGFIGIFTDHTSSKETEMKIKHLAYHDYLTDLPSRRLIDDKLFELMKKNNSIPIALLHLNLDRFKSVNELLGHKLGDKVLKQVAKRISNLLDGNSLLARIGGDEFYVLIWDYKKESAPAQLANTIVNNFKNSFYANDYEISLTTSIGVCRYPEDSDSDNQLRSNAGSALTRAKQKGRNTYEVYFPSESILTYKLYMMERGLLKSIDRGELFLEFQPRVNVKTGKLVSAEALVRWKHPEWGIISPKEFIPLAEESGFVLQIGDWVLEQVVMFLKRWDQKGLDLVPISINISAKRFLRNNWGDYIKNILSDRNINPNLIELEITENSLIHYKQEIHAVLAYLKQLGLRIALDDFGTGYSSLSYLKDYPIDTIKIDKSFIDNIEKCVKDQAIIKAVINLANDLNKCIVAEGVETENQLQFLKSLNCDEVQGYLFSKPLPEHEFQAVLRNKQLEAVVTPVVPLAPVSKEAIQFDHPVKADMKLISINNKKVQLGSTKIVINNLRAQQLTFLSIINLPVRKDFIYKLTLNILNHEFSYNGFVIDKQEIDEMYEYDLLLMIDEPEKRRLERLLSILTRLLSQNAVLLEKNFIKNNVFIYLKNQQGM